MQIEVLSIGASKEIYLITGIKDYTERLKHYVRFVWTEVKPPKNAAKMSQTELKKAEADIIFSQTAAAQIVILLDEKGKQYSSEQFAHFFSQKANEGIGKIIFVIGGPYGFDESVYQKFPIQISLSKMTFSHQMIRLLIVEQIYRAFTIVKGEKYHH